MRLSLSRAKQQTFMTKECLTTSPWKDTTHQTRAVFKALERLNSKLIWQTSHFRRSRLLQCDKYSDFHQLTVINKPGWRSNMRANRKTSAKARITSKLLQPAFLVAARKKKKITIGGKCQRAKCARVAPQRGTKLYINQPSIHLRICLVVTFISTVRTSRNNAFF